MEFTTIILILSGLFALSVIFSVTALVLYSSRKKNRVKEMVSGVLAGSSSDALAGSKRQTRIMDVEEIKRSAKDSIHRREAQHSSSRLKLQTTEVLRRDQLSQSETGISPEDAMFFKAGFYTNADKLLFKRFQLISPIVSTALGICLIVILRPSIMMTISFGVLALFVGVSFPKSWLERKIRAREEEILSYLPIAIEQISIGVSSSLDLWPCISHILEMARARDSFNPVTELFIHIERLIISGLSFTEALHEVGQASGVHQVKHAFQFLSQCSEHGGEISKQLQELASAISTERQTYVEGKISSLPVKATGPLFMVFAGFFSLMLAGVFSRMVSALSFGG